MKSDEQLVKSARKYTRTARKAWEALSLPEDREIDIEGESHWLSSVLGADEGRERR